MQMQPTENAQPQFPMQELEQIESAIEASLKWFATLEGRRAVLSKELERITRPQSVIAKAPPKMVGPGVEYRGEMSVHWHYINIHIDLLRRLWTEFPEHREAMAKAMGHYGTSRAYVATTLAELFPDRSTAWGQRHSRELVSGWYVDTNLNLKRMRRILPAAVATAGLEWNKDVKVYWHRSHLS